MPAGRSGGPIGFIFPCQVEDREGRYETLADGASELCHYRWGVVERFFHICSEVDTVTEAMRHLNGDIYYYWHARNRPPKPTIFDALKQAATP